MKLAKKLARILAITIGCIILLNIMLVLVFTIPSVQKYAANFALEKLKPIVKTDMSINNIRIKLFNAVEIGGLYIEDQKNDTLLYADKLAAHVNIINLLNNQLSIEIVRLSDFTANIYRETPDSAFNFQFIIDAFAPADTIKKKPSENPLKIGINDIKLTNGTLRYDIRSAPETPGRFNANHFMVKNFNLDIAIPSLDISNLVADINSLTFDEEKAGIGVEKFRGMIRSEGTRLWSDEISLTFNNSQVDITKAIYDTQTGEFSLKIGSQIIAPKDVAIFAEQLAHLHKPFAFDADVEGKIPHAEVKNLTAKYGNQTAFSLNGLISDFMKPDKADININIPNLKLAVSDLNDFIRIGSPTFESVSQLDALENIDLNLKAKGKLSNLGIAIRVNTAPGTISFDGKGSTDIQFNNIVVDGNLTTNNLQVAKIIGNEIGANELSYSTKAGIEIKKNQPLAIWANGNIESVLYKGYRYHDLALNATLNGSDITAQIITDTEKNRLNLNADLGFGNELKFDVRGTVDKLFLEPLIKIEKWKNPFLTARINAKLQGSGIDDLVGNVVIDSTSLYDDNFIYNPGPIYLQALSADANGGEKRIQLYSSVFEGEIWGDYRFTTIGNELVNALRPHLPTLIGEALSKEPKKASNNFKFNFLLKNTEDISYALSLPFVNVEPASIGGTVDTKTQKLMSLNGYIPRLMLGQNDIRESKVDINLEENSGARLNIGTYLVQEDGHINAKLNTNVASDSISNSLVFNVDNNIAFADGNLNISAGFARNAADSLVSTVSIHPAQILFNEKNINIVPSSVVFEKEKIAVNNFEIRENGMLLLGIGGVASKKRDDAIRAFFNNTELETILATFGISNFKGAINGGVVVNQALAEPLIRTENFRIENICTQTDTIGTFAIDGNWDIAKKGLILNANLKDNQNSYLAITGFVPTGDDNPMDVNISVNRLPLAWVQPFAVSALSQLSGTVNSNLNLSGKTNAPITEGWLGINDGVMTPAFTNVTYRISDTISISPKNIGLNNLVIKDDNNREAHLNLSLNHSNFEGITYKANIILDDFLLLNNEKRTDKIAYGMLKLSGNIDINGSSSGIFGTANLRNESRSNIKIELPQTAQATEYGGIIYINTPEEIDSLSFLRKEKKGDNQLNTRLNSGIPMNIQAIIDLNPTLEVGVVINPTTGDALQINGTGQIRANFDTKSNPQLRFFGDYVVQEGKFRYNIQSLKTIDFAIRAGSTVTLVGDPLNTQFNITAYDRINVNLATLSEIFTTQLSNTRTAANATLEIQGNMRQMNLKYGIELPDVSNDVRQRLNSFISTDEQKNRQFAALVLTSNFFPAEGSIVAGVGSRAATTFAAGQISKGLDMLFAGVLNDNWTVSTNLESGDGSLDNVRMGVDVSTRLLNNRLRLSTNLSYGDKSSMASQQAFMGEFELEYDINNWLMIRAYNRANQRFSRRSPTTQGAGVVVTKNSRQFRDLFKFSFGKKD